MVNCKSCLRPNSNLQYRYCQACHLEYRAQRNIRLKHKPSKETCVYFIRSGDMIKIGYTSNIEDRKSSLQTNNPIKIEVLKTIPGGYEEEQELHRKFSHLNKQGEWFFAAKELLDFISCK